MGESSRPFGIGNKDDSKLFVGGISPNITDDILRQMFGTYGIVLDVRLIMDRDLNIPKGYGFVTMDSPGAAHSAIKGLSGYKLGEKIISVRMAGANKGGPGGGPGGPGWLHSQSTYLLLCQCLPRLCWFVGSPKSPM